MVSHLQVQSVRVLNYKLKVNERAKKTSVHKQLAYKSTSDSKVNSTGVMSECKKINVPLVQSFQEKTIQSLSSGAALYNMPKKLNILFSNNQFGNLVWQCMPHSRPFDGNTYLGLKHLKLSFV